jgi:hypothetical protein
MKIGDRVHMTSTFPEEGWSPLEEDGVVVGLHTYGDVGTAIDIDVRWDHTCSLDEIDCSVEHEEEWSFQLPATSVVLINST